MMKFDITKYYNLSLFSFCPLQIKAGHYVFVWNLLIITIKSNLLYLSD